MLGIKLKHCVLAISLLLPSFVSFAKAEEKKQINTIIDLAHGFSFYGDGRFSAQYTPNQPWTRNLASFKFADFSNANANLLILFPPESEVPYTREDAVEVRQFLESGGTVFLSISKGKGYEALSEMFGVALSPQNVKKSIATDTLMDLINNQNINVKHAGNIYALDFDRQSPQYKQTLPLKWTTYIQADGNTALPIVAGAKVKDGTLLVVPRNLFSSSPGSHDARLNGEWIQPLIEKSVTKQVVSNIGPKGRSYTEQDFKQESDGFTIHYNQYLDTCYKAMHDIIKETKPLILKRMGVPLHAQNGTEIALLATGGGGFSAGRVVGLAVFWENFPHYRPGMYEFVTHEMVHSWVHPFTEVWNEPIATYVGDLVMQDAGYPDEGKRRIKNCIERAKRIDPTMKKYDLNGNPANASIPKLKEGHNDIHWGKSFWVWEELTKQNPSILSDYFKAKRLHADPTKIKHYGINETVAVFSYAMKKDMFPWFNEHGIKADPNASEIKYTK